MTNEEAQIVIGNIPLHPKVLDDCYSITEYQEAKAMAIEALEQESTIKALGEELRKARKGIADEKVLIGYNLAVAICNKYLGESEDDE